MSGPGLNYDLFSSGVTPVTAARKPSRIDFVADHLSSPALPTHGPGSRATVQAGITLKNGLRGET
jgi:hypothetical protein